MYTQSRHELMGWPNIYIYIYIYMSGFRRVSFLRKIIKNTIDKMGGVRLVEVFSTSRITTMSIVLLPENLEATDSLTLWVLNTRGLCRPCGRRASSADGRCGRNTFSLDWTLLIDYSKPKS